MEQKIFFVDNFNRASLELFGNLIEQEKSTKNNFSFEFIGPSKNLPTSQINFINKINKIWNNNHYVKNIFKYIRSSKPKIIHISFELKTFGDFFSVIKFPILLFLIRFTKTKIVLSLHTMLVYRENSKWHIYDYIFSSMPKSFLTLLVKIYTKIICKLSHKIIVEANIGKKALTEYFNLDDDKIEVIQLGVSPKTSLANKINQTNISEKINQKKIILCFGVISPRKRLDDIIRAFNKITNDLPNHILVIAGSAPIEHKLYESELKKLSKDLGIDNKIIFAGFLNDFDIEYLFSISDMAIFIYRPMASGTGALTFAIQYGTPCIVSNIETFQEILSEKSALFVNPDNANELSENMLKMALNDNLKTELQTEIQKISQRFTWKESAIKHIKIYENLL